NGFAGGPGQVAHGDDPVAPDADVGPDRGLAAAVVHRAAADEHVEGPGRSGRALAGPAVGAPRQQDGGKGQEWEEVSGDERRGGHRRSPAGGKYPSTLAVSASYQRVGDGDRAFRAALVGTR